MKGAIESIEYLNQVCKNRETSGFKQVLKSIGSQDKILIIPSLYKWIGQFNLEEPTLKVFTPKTWVFRIN